MVEKKAPAKREVSVNVVLELGLQLDDLQKTKDAVGMKALHAALAQACETLESRIYEGIRANGDWVFLVLGLPGHLSISNFVSQLKRLSTLAVTGRRPGASSQKKTHLWSRSYSARSCPARQAAGVLGGVHDAP